ncbi:MAG: Ig-like domain-containing protein [bacterium]
MSARSLLSLSAIAVALLPGGARATTVTVDGAGGGDYLTIQAGLDAVAAGDTVRVVAGTYAGAGNTNLNFDGKDVLLQSISGADLTIIQGDGTGPGLVFDDGEPAGTVVEGFTITGCERAVTVSAGSAPTILDCTIAANQASGDGAGVWVSGASPTIEGCFVVENEATGRSGGIHAELGASDVLSVLATVIVGNSSGTYGGGGVIAGGGSATFTACTITGNRSYNGGIETGGGGLAVIDALTSVALVRTILWGNPSAAGAEEDGVVMSVTGSLSFTCCNIDSSGVGGTGNVTYAGTNVFENPHFCLPANFREGSAWTDGDYTLAANSPNLAANNACGQRIGALGAGCGPVHVWTGASGNFDWFAPANWSPGTIPDSTSHVQLAEGVVEIVGGTADVSFITQCPEGAGVDSLYVGPGGALRTSCAALGRTADQTTSYGGGTQLNGGDIELCDPDPGLPTMLILPTGRLWTCGGRMHGAGTILIQGAWTSTFDCGSDSTEVEGVAVEIAEAAAAGGAALARGGGASSGVVVESGVLSLSQPLANHGTLEVAEGATLRADVRVERTGTFQLNGTLDEYDAGDGLSNVGSVAASAATTATAFTPMTNDRDDAAGAIGHLTVTSGVLRLAAGIVNRADVDVDPGAELRVGAASTNESAGSWIVRGDVTGAGTLENFGLIEKRGTMTSAFDPALTNARDAATLVPGELGVAAGVLEVGSLDNDGRVVVQTGGELRIGNLAHRENALIAGRGRVVVTDPTPNWAGEVRPGAPVGVLTSLTIEGLYDPRPFADLSIELGGTDPGVDHDQVIVEGSTAPVFGGGLSVTLANGFTPAAGDSFLVLRDDTVASGALHRGASFDCLSGTQLPGGIVLDPVVTTDGLVLVARASTPSNAFPVAVPDTFAVALAAITQVGPLANDTDADGDPLRIVRVAAEPTYGTAVIEAGDQTLLYLPGPSFPGTDTLTYVVTDCAGAVDSTTVTLTTTVTSIADGVSGGAGVTLRAPSPNPSRGLTRVHFELARAVDVTLDVFDVRGRRVASLARGRFPAGTHAVDWDGSASSGGRVAAGIYFVRFESEGQVETRKVVVLR